MTKIKTLREIISEGKPFNAQVIREQAEGAWPNGTRVFKTIYKESDAHQVGAKATVVGSLGPANGIYGYFVEWDDMPGIPVFVAGTRIAMVSA